MGRSLGFIAAGTALAVVLTGCGASKTGTAAPPGAPASSSGVAAGSTATWVDGFCGALIELGGLSSVQMPQVKAGDVENARKGLVDILAKAESAFGSAVDGLGKLPAAPVAAGETAKRSLLEIFSPVLRKVTDARAKLLAAPPGDTQSILDATTALQSIGTEASKLDDPLNDIKASPELEEAARSAPNCQKLPA